MAHCVNCGKNQKDSQRFCRFCGEKQPGEQLLARLKSEAARLKAGDDGSTGAAVDGTMATLARLEKLRQQADDAHQSKDIGKRW